MTLQCPRCKNDNVQNIEMAYKAGTSSMTGKVSGGGLGISTLGVGVGVGGGKLSGTQQTELAKSLAPPKNQSAVLLSLILVTAPGATFMALSFVDTYYIRNGLTWVAWVSIVVGILAVVLYARSDMAKKLNAEYAKAIDYWSKSFICFKCGMHFLPPDVQTANGGSPKFDAVAIDDELVALVRMGKKVDAIKRYQGASGARLDEAVKYVESL